jgi:hypothetical protein
MQIPAASDTSEALADWLEVQALRAATREASLESLIRVIRRAGSTDAVAGPNGDRGSEESQRVGQDAFSEIGNRVRACGDGRYPFEVEQGSIRLKKDAEKSFYVFLLLISIHDPTSGHYGTAALFEHLCCHAAHRYLGGNENHANAFRIGAPRKAPIAKFHQAVDELCAQVAEGGGCLSPEKGQHTGDNGLDIVAWRNFPDLRAGKLIAFGQCACGATDWESKLQECDGSAFMKKWFRSPLVVDPIRLFFLPRRVRRDDWEHSGIDGGILFDRCRIVACLTQVDAELAGRCAKTATGLLKEIRKTAKAHTRLKLRRN